jgi:hypothetical protein
LYRQKKVTIKKNVSFVKSDKLKMSNQNGTRKKENENENENEQDNKIKYLLLKYCAFGFVMKTTQGSSIL